MRCELSLYDSPSPDLHPIGPCPLTNWFAIPDPAFQSAISAALETVASIWQLQIPRGQVVRFRLFDAVRGTVFTDLLSKDSMGGALALGLAQLLGRDQVPELAHLDCSRIGVTAALGPLGSFRSVGQLSQKLGTDAHYLKGRNLLKTVLVPHDQRDDFVVKEAQRGGINVEPVVSVEEAIRLLARAGMEQDVVGVHELDFGAYADAKRKDYLGGHALLQAIQDWCERPVHENASPVLLVSGDIGCGKSCLAAKLLEAYRPRIVAHHFFRHDEPETWNPRQFVQSLSAMLAANLQAYSDYAKSEGIQPLMEEDPGHFFRQGVLYRLPPTMKATCWVVIDGVELASAAGRTDDAQAVLAMLGTVLAKSSTTCPWLRFIITSRDPGLLDEFGTPDLLSFEAFQADQQRDLTRLATRLLQESRLSAAQQESLTRELALHAGGHFRFARLVLDSVLHGETATATAFGDLLTALSQATPDAVRMLCDETTRLNVILDPAELIARLKLRCPYRGLLAFEAEHSDYFMGRSTLIQSVFDRMDLGSGHDQFGRFVAISGASGSGKSSFVRAGLVPTIYRALHRIDARQQPPLVLTPGGTPLRRLAAALATWAADLLGRPWRDAAEIEDAMRHDVSGLDATVTAVLAEAQSSQTLVLVIDQFEELFTLTAEDGHAERSAYIGNLLQASLTGTRTLFILTLRADFWGECSDYARLADEIPRHSVLLKPMSGDQLREVIEVPANRCGLVLESGLTQLLLMEMENQPAGALPFLQHALEMLWTARVGRTLPIATYKEMGGIMGALKSYADDLYYKTLKSDAERQACRHILVQLTHIGETAASDLNEAHKDTRERVNRDQLGYAPATVAALNALIASRLVTASVNQQLEIAHESLIRGWPLFQEWLNKDRASSRVLQKLNRDAAEWRERQRDSAYLYRGSLLENALVLEDSLAGFPWALEFLAASRQQAENEATEKAEKEHRERSRWLVGTTAVLAAIVSSGARITIARTIGTFLVPIADRIPAGQTIIPTSGWNGVFGGFAGAFLLVGAHEFSTHFPKQRWVQDVSVAMSGVLWGILMFVACQAALMYDIKHAIGWDSCNVKYGFVVTGALWGIGAAVGLRLAAFLATRSPRFKVAVHIATLYAAIAAIVFLSPLILSHVIVGMTDAQMMSRILGDSLHQTLTAWASLGIAMILKHSGLGTRIFKWPPEPLYP